MPQKDPSNFLRKRSNPKKKCGRGSASCTDTHFLIPHIQFKRTSPLLGPNHRNQLHIIHHPPLLYNPYNRAQQRRPVQLDRKTKRNRHSSLPTILTLHQFPANSYDVDILSVTTLRGSRAQSTRGSLDHFWVQLDNNPKNIFLFNFDGFDSSFGWTGKF